MRLVVVFVALLFEGGRAFAASAPPLGHTLALSVPRTSEAPRIDGVLSEDVWRDAAHTTAFWIAEYGRTPREQTEVLVIADANTLYFGFICHDARPKDIYAEQSRRDGNFTLDDRVTVELDPFHDHRLLSYFSVNARGTQADSMAGGRAHKIEWKGDWAGAASRSSDGWTAEMAIPFDILRFERGTRTFGVNFVRYHNRTQEWSRWANTTAQFLPEEAGHLTDLVLPDRPRVNRLMVMEYAAGGLNTPDAKGRIRDAAGSAGFDVRYDMSGSLSTVLSINPDFSQVEDAVLGIGFDYNEKYRPDHRPFFQEGAGFFGNRMYFYSGRVPDFAVGAKSFGKVGAYQVGILGVHDNANARSDYVGQVTRELGPTVQATATFVGTNRLDLDNHLAAFHVGGRAGRRLVFGADVATTSTSRIGGDGMRATGHLGLRNTRWSAGINVDQTAAQFFPANGFLAGDLRGTRGASGYLSYNREYGNGWLRRSSFSVSYGGRNTWDGRLQRRNTSVYGSLETRSNIELVAGTTRGPYRPRDGRIGSWSDALNHDDYSMIAAYYYTPRARLGYGATYSWGFLGGADYSDLAPSVWLKPARTVSISYSYERADYFGVTSQNVLSAAWEITPNQFISGRWVQYDGPSYRLVYRRSVRRGVDVYGVYSRDPFTDDRFVAKLVWTSATRARDPQTTVPPESMEPPRLPEPPDH